jgi:hypothetical protein
MMPPVEGRQPPQSPDPETLEAHTEAAIAVRQVTQFQASWTEEQRGEPGAFTLQLILDHGATEYVLRPTAEDMTALVQLLERNESAFFDMERKVLIFATRPASSDRPIRRPRP